MLAKNVPTTIAQSGRMLKSGISTNTPKICPKLYVNPVNWGTINLFSDCNPAIKKALIPKIICGIISNLTNNTSSLKLEGLSNGLLFFTVNYKIAPIMLGANSTTIIAKKVNTRRNIFNPSTNVW